MTLSFILLFLFLSALFSGSEIAFISANKLRVELRKKKGAARGRILANFYEKPAHFLSTMLVGNNIALVAFTILMGSVLAPLLEKTLGLQEQELLLLLLDTIIITVVVLIFGEFLPKTLFSLYADQILYFLALPLKFIEVALRPLTWIMTRFSNRFLSVFFKSSITPVETAFTRLDLENFINDTLTDAEEEIDKELFGKALNFKEVKVRDCMVPRTEIENIDVSSNLEELEQLFRETKLSRLIVTDNDIDNVLGYVHHQQLFQQPDDLKKLVLNISFVAEVTRVTDLMNDFIRTRTSIACVVDEFGAVAGIITLEDILEEIFGEIEDEHDQGEYVENQISDDEYIFSGRLEISYLNEKFDIGLPEGDYHTLSGYLVTTTETIPEKGAQIELDGFRFILELVSNTKIETVRVIRLPAIP